MNEGGRFPFLVFLAANVRAWTFGSASGILQPKMELGTGGSKPKEHGVCRGEGGHGVLWGGRVQPAGAGAGAMAYSFTDKPRNRTRVSCISCFAGGFFTCWTTGEANVYMNKFGETVLTIFLTVWHPLSPGSGEFLQIWFSTERQHVSCYRGNHVILPADESRVVTRTLCEAGCWLSLPPLLFGDKSTI